MPLATKCPQLLQNGIPQQLSLHNFYKIPLFSKLTKFEQHLQNSSQPHQNEISII